MSTPSWVDKHARNQFVCWEEFIKIFFNIDIDIKTPKNRMILI